MLYEERVARLAGDPPRLLLLSQVRQQQKAPARLPCSTEPDLEFFYNCHR